MSIKGVSIKKNRGFTTADIVVAIVVMMIFVGMIATLFYNFYLSTTAKNRNAMATNYIVDVIEEIKAMNYDEVQKDTQDSNSINNLIQQLEATKQIPKEYIIFSIFQLLFSKSEITFRINIVLSEFDKYSIGRIFFFDNLLFALFVNLVLESAFNLFQFLLVASDTNLFMCIFSFLL